MRRCTWGLAEGVAQESPAFLGALGCEEDDGASTLSELSGLSDLSEPSSGSEWKPSSEGPMGWVQRQMSLGADPRALLERLLPEGALVPPSLDRLTLWRILVSVLSEDEPPRRAKLPHVNTLDDVVHLLRSCRRILVLTGAGVSGWWRPLPPSFPSCLSASGLPVYPPFHSKG